jgi:MYXO-CTERM domain-containing protein
MLNQALRNTAAAAAIAMGALPAAAVELLVPAYFYPSFDPALSQWDEMTAAAAAGAKITAIVNPNNGPGSAVNSDYTRAINDFRAAGGKVLGYVYTCYGNNTCNPALPAARTTADVLADAQKYQTWYGVDGIFLDEMSNLDAALPFYTTVAQGLRAAQPTGQIVGNPGTSTPASYLNVADTIVTFERGTGSYAGTSTEPWMTTAAPNRQAHLHYGVGTEAAMRDLLQQAVARNAGYVYISNDVLPNPWDQLPSYWQAEVAAVASISSVPEASSAWMMGLGGLLLTAALRRRDKSKPL